MPKELPKPRGTEVEAPLPAARKPRRTRRREGPHAEVREELRERELQRAASSNDGKVHDRFEDTEYPEGEYDDGGTGIPWLHRENPEIWVGGICDDV